VKYDFSYVLKNLDGSDAVEADGPATALKGLRTALISDPQGLTASDKSARYSLFIKLSKATADTEFTVEEVALLKKAADIFPTMVYGQLCALLDQTL
jgi:hypothetical protein